MRLNNEQKQLVEKNMGLVGAVIRDNVRNIGRIGIFTYDDIFQIGCEGLSKAACCYSPGRGEFSTYAYISIRNSIFNALDYATVRRHGEVIADIETILSLAPVKDEFDVIDSDIDAILDSARARASASAAKGIDAIRLMAMGYTSREIGELMGGVSANNVTAWVSKARAFLCKDPNFLMLRAAI